MNQMLEPSLLEKHSSNFLFYIFFLETSSCTSVVLVLIPATKETNVTEVQRNESK